MRGSGLVSPGGRSVVRGEGICCIVLGEEGMGGASDVKSGLESWYGILF